MGKYYVGGSDLSIWRDQFGDMTLSANSVISPIPYGSYRRVNYDVLVRHGVWRSRMGVLFAVTNIRQNLRAPKGLGYGARPSGIASLFGSFVHW